MKRDEQPSVLSSRKSVKVKWEIVSKELIIPNIVIRIAGPTGTGRTNQAFTVSGPYSYFSFGENWRGVLEEVRRRGDDVEHVRCHGNYLGTPREIMVEASKQLDKIFAYTLDALKRRRRTIIYDTDFALWDTFKRYRMGATKSRGGSVSNNYTDINAAFLALLQLLKSQETSNVVFIGQTKDVWADNKEKTYRVPSGEVEIIGNDQCSTHANLVLVTRLEKKKRGEKETEANTVEKVNYIRVEKEPFNFPCRGMEFTNADMLENPWDSKSEDGRLNLPEILEAITGMEGWDK